MKLRLRRIALKDTYTIGKLEVLHLGQWLWLADTCEDKVRDLNKDGDLNDIGECKIMHETAIPYGEYELTMNVKSPRYSNYKKYPWAEEFDGYLPRFVNVKHFEGVLIHPGNHIGDTSGCVLVGENKVKGQVLNSISTFKKIMREWFIPVKKRDEKIIIEII